MDLETAQTNTTAKLPLLKQGEYDMWKLRIEQYFQVQDYALWDVIENGNSFKPAAQTTTNVDGSSTTLIPGPVTADEKTQKKNDVKARNFVSAIQTRFGGNDAIKKTKKTLLKKMYKNFSAPKASEDCNSTNEVNTAYGVSTTNTQVSTASTQDLEQIHEDDLEDIDLKWQLALLSMRTRKFFQKTGRKITIIGSDTSRYDKSKVECFNCHKLGHFARECRGPRNQDNRSRNQDSSRRTINVEETSSKAMLAIDGAGFDWSFMADKEVPIDMALMDFSDSEVHNDKTYSKTCLKSFETLKTQLDDLRIEFNKSEFNLATYKRGLTFVEEQLVFYKKNELEKHKQEKESNQLMIKKFDNASKSLDKLIGSQIPNKSRKGLRFISYNVVLPPPTGLFSPPNLGLSNSGLEEFQQPEFKGYGPKTSKSVSEDTSNEVRESPDALLVEELVSNDKLEKKTVFPTVAKINFVRPQQQEKPVRKPVKYAKMYRVNYNYSAKKAHPSAHKNIVPRAVLMKTGLRLLNTARPVNTTHPKTTVYSARSMSCFSKSAQSTVNAIKALACWVWRPTKLNSASISFKRHNYVDARGRSKHITGNMSYLSDFKEFDRGYVTFGGGSKGGRITGKGTLKTGKLNCEDVYFVKELQFNLFSISQICDKKNSVLFTDIGCFVLSLDFKLADES
ncbi:ribonuclease H-like domain-containing protein [Tanacetum coccineum]